MTISKIQDFNSITVQQRKNESSSHLQKFVESILGTIPTISRATPNGLLHRETKGLVLHTHVKAKDKELFDKIKTFDVVPKLPFDKNPLTESQKKKAEELITKSKDEKIVNKLKLLLYTSQKNRASRLDYQPEEWEALDLVNFELTQDHMKNLHTFFETSSEDKNQKNWKKIGINRKEALVAETLAKALAYTEGLDGKSIKIPVIDEKGKSRLVNYTIELTVVGDNLPCYVLESKDPNTPPWFVARGTETIVGEKDGKEFRQGAQESMYADLIDPNTVGGRVVTKAMVNQPILKSNSGKIKIGLSLNDYFQKWKGKKINLAGHSLGGYIVTDIAVRFSDQVKTSYGFSSPGLGKEIALKFDEKKIPEEKIVNFDIEGDLVPSAGRYYRGLHLATSNRGQDPLHTHIEHNLNNQNFTIVKVDNQKESEKLSRRIISEGARKTTGRMIKGIVSLKQIFSRKQELPGWEQHRNMYKKIAQNS